MNIRPKPKIRNLSQSSNAMTNESEHNQPYESFGDMKKLCSFDFVSKTPKEGKMVEVDFNYLWMTGASFRKLQQLLILQFGIKDKIVSLLIIIHWVTTYKGLLTNVYIQ